jgi:hypothetical protein
MVPSQIKLEGHRRHFCSCKVDDSTSFQVVSLPKQTLFASKSKKKKKNAKSDKFFGGHFIFRKQHLIGRHSYLEVVMLFFLVGKVVDQKVGYMVVLSDVINFLFILFASCLLSTRIHCASSLNFYNNGEANCTTKKLLLPEIHFWLFPE